MTKTPALFIGHGSPMNTLELNGFTRAWRELGRQLPRPRALLVVSAHWYFAGTAATAMQRPRTIHDFYGFPPELFGVQYPAPGSPEVAREVVEALKPAWAKLDRNQWGIDHGAWSVLAHLYPEADVPVVQLSIHSQKPMEYHLELGAKLAGLRDQGIMVLASGNVVHNLRMIEWDKPDEGRDWAQRFDDAVVEQMATDPAGMLKLTSHPDYAMAVPTPDHFIPLLYLAGLAAADGVGAEAILRGYSMGSLSMTCYGVGTDVTLQAEAHGAAEIPDHVPPQQTNT